MKKKQHNPFRKALIISLIRQGEPSNKKIAAQARCSSGYVAIIRSKLKKEAQLSEPEPKVVPFESTEPSTTEFPVWAFAALAAAAIVAIASVIFVINSI